MRRATRELDFFFLLVLTPADFSAVFLPAEDPPAALSRGAEAPLAGWPEIANNSAVWNERCGTTRRRRDNLEISVTDDFQSDLI